MASEEDPLNRIAESLARLERLYSEDLRRQEERDRATEDRLQELQERQEKVNALDLGRYNPWVQPREIAYLLLTAALLVLSGIIYYLSHR